MKSKQKMRKVRTKITFEVDKTKSVEKLLNSFYDYILIKCLRKRKTKNKIKINT
jgi:hypothetical protein